MLDFTIITLTILCADLGQGKDSTKEYDGKKRCNGMKIFMMR